MVDVAAAPAATLPTGPAAARQGSDVVAVLLRSRTFLLGAAVVTFWVLDAVLWGLVVPYDPQAVGAQPLAGPSGEHLLGTDNLGRDVLSRLLAGASTVVAIAPAATLLGLAGGVLIGLLTGYHRGLVDDVVMRGVDALLAFPVIIIAILVLASLGPSSVNVMLTIGIIFAPLVGRTVRSAVLVERERAYVAAARLQGEGSLRIMLVEILPNVTGPILVEGTLRLGYAVLTVAGLSFLGLGLRTPSPDWGLAISEGRTYVQAAPWMVLSPAIALATLIVGVNLVADALRRAVER